MEFGNGGHPPSPFVSFIPNSKASHSFNHFFPRHGSRSRSILRRSPGPSSSPFESESSSSTSRIELGRGSLAAERPHSQTVAAFVRGRSPSPGDYTPRNQNLSSTIDTTALASRGSRASTGIGPVTQQGRERRPRGKWSFLSSEQISSPAVCVIRLVATTYLTELRFPIRSRAKFPTLSCLVLEARATFARFLPVSSS